MERSLKSSMLLLPPAILFNHIKWTAKVLELAVRKQQPAPDFSLYAKSATFKTLLNLHASLVEALIVTATASLAESPNASVSRRHKRLLFQATRLTRRFLLLGREPAVRATLEALLADAPVEGNPRGVTVIGAAVDVALHKGFRAVVEGKADAIGRFFEKSVLGSKSAVPTPFVDALGSFFKAFGRGDLLEKQVLGNVERLMLRTPEIVIRIFDRVFHSVEVDTARIFREKFADLLLNNMKSSSEFVRSDAASLFKTLAAKSIDPIEAEKVTEITIKALTGKSPSTDQKQLYYSCAASLPKLAGVSRRIIKSLPALVQKEISEAVVVSCYSAVAQHISHALSSEQAADAETISAITNFFTTGLSEAKSLHRRVVLQSLEAGVSSNEAIAGLTEAARIAIAEACIKVLDKVQAAGIAMLDPKKEGPSPAEGYLTVSWLLDVLSWESGQATTATANLLQSKRTFAALLSSPTAKNYWFLNEKYYHKLSHSEADHQAFAKCVLAILQRDELYALVGTADTPIEKALLSKALAFVSVDCPYYRVRRFALESLRKFALQVPTKAIQAGRWAVGTVLNDSERVLVPPVVNPAVLDLSSKSLSASSLGSPDASSIAGERSSWGDDAKKVFREISMRLFSVLQAVVPPSDRSLSDDDSNENAEEDPATVALSRSVINLAAIASHPVFARGTAGADAWIQLCIRAGLDAPTVVEAYGDEVIASWLDIVAHDPSSGVLDSHADMTLGGLTPPSSGDPDADPQSWRTATLAALSLFTAVSPSTTLSSVLPVVLTGLDSKWVADVSVEDIEIFHGEEGVLVGSVLSKSKGAVDDRPRTAEEKWDQELRKELEAKKGKSGSSAASGKGSAGAAKGGKAAAVSKAEKEAERALLEAESATRRRVRAIRAKVKSALDALEAVVNGVANSLGDEARNALEEWMAPVVACLVNNVISRELVVVRNGSDVPKGAVLVGEQSILLFRALAHASDERLSRVVDMGWDIALLRLIGVEQGGDGLPLELCKKDLSVFLTKMLMTAKAEFNLSNPLRPGGFAFIFPLIEALIHLQGRAPNMKEKIRTELTMIAADILIAHASLGASPLAPRRTMIRAIIELLNRFPRLHGAAREALLTFCVSFEDAVGTAEEEHDMLDPYLRDIAVGDEAAITEALLDALLSPEPVAREASLRALQHLSVPEGARDGLPAARVWTAKEDSVESIAAEAARAWEMWNDGEDIEADALPHIVKLITHAVADVRVSSGRGLRTALECLPDKTSKVLDSIFELYKEKNVVPMPEYDTYGMIIPESLDRKDEWPARSGLALALKSCAPVLTNSAHVTQVFQFLIKKEALGDREERVRSEMLEAGVAIIGISGKTMVKDLLKIFSDYLLRPAGSSKTHDAIRESAVILMGTAARHLEPSDPKIPQVINQLVDTLKTPSETVQIAVSECLPALIKVMPGDPERLVKKLLDQLYGSPKYAERRGAAYGLAGVVKGKGIASLKEFEIMSSLKEAVEDKKKTERREGALFAFEALSTSLGRLFEPYVIQILPLLLVCYGDAQRSVREATQDACKAIMSKLSGHCVKLVLPSLLNGLNDKNWRTKTGSIEVMGSMAYLAPKQLSLSLPTIVPKIVEVLTDTHIKVHETAKNALNVFGKVIRNPEIQELVPVLIAALVNPNAKTLPALTALIETSFVHYVDAPSLALIVPILDRGLHERATNIKQRAAQIMGQMSSLTDQKDLVPYLTTLLPGLKEVLVDPNPEARATAAHALGLMFDKLGESNFVGLVPELLQTLKSETSAVDRSGAAQGLAEILASTNVEKMEGLLPDIITNALSIRTYVREGFLTLLVYLPITFGERFKPYLGSIVTPILRGLADETETVRETAMKAGRNIVRNYAQSAITLLLPGLVDGLFDEMWRIRHSSVQLLGELLFKIAGISGKVEVEGEEEMLGTEHGKKALVEALGQELFESVLASLYILRNDESGTVRNAALHVWKSIVSNTPRQLKEIMAVLITLVISSLASPSEEKRELAARTLADLVRKLGENVLLEIVPVLERGLDSDDVHKREGVCVGMTEIMASSSKAQLVDFLPKCIPCVRRALVDPEPDVREAAAQAFDMLHQHIGPKAVDEVLPTLLNELKAGGTSSSSNYALEALKEIMSVRSNVVFPVLIPTLLSSPITSFNARALGSLIAVAGSSLNKRLANILPALMDGLDQGDAAVQDILDTLKVLLENVDEEGLPVLMPLLSEAVKEGTPEKRRSACQSLTIFFQAGNVDASAYVGNWIYILIEMLRGPPAVDEETMKEAWAALDAATRTITKDQQDDYVVPLRRAIANAVSTLGPDAVLPGFCLPKGISPVLPFFLQGLMYGSPDVREDSSAGLGDLILRTTPEAIKPFVTQITGPLIRIIGDRFPAGVKASILNTLSLLLTKVPALLKPFLPQLQRTFIKSLSESTNQVRDPARRCLTLLIGQQTRLDPLVTELTGGLKTSDDRGVKEAMWDALFDLLNSLGSGGRAISDASKKTVETLVLEAALKSGENDDAIRQASAKCLGALLKSVPVDEARSAVISKLLKPEEPNNWCRQHGAALSLKYVVALAPGVADAKATPAIVSFLVAGLRHDKPQIIEACVPPAGKLLEAAPVAAADVAQLVSALVQVSKPEMMQPDASRMAVIAIKNVAKTRHEIVAPHLNAIVPTMMACVRGRVIPVKLAAERALVHLFCLRSPTSGGGGGDVLTQYLTPLDTASARTVGDYARKVLSKLAEADTDVEEGDV
ncbi:armadillo-type protein [Zopfochytrium polystomum]|nr:armadillo-type protein [Zopfochytrium polystomum]